MRTLQNIVLIGRFLQGMWSGGEALIETAYIAENISMKYRTEVKNIMIRDISTHLNVITYDR